jgi:hypothetical protein
MVESHFRQQSLKALAVLGSLSAQSLVLVDNKHTISGPTELLRQLGQRVLALS